MAEMGEGYVELEEDGLDVRDYHEAEETEEERPQGEFLSTEQLQELRDAAETVRQFRADPVSAIRAMAPQLGLQIAEAGAAPSGQAASQRSGPPESFVRQIEDNIRSQNPDLAFMAPMLAQASWAAAEQRAAPIETEHKALLARARTAEYHQALEPLRTKNPDWHTHEGQMNELWTWIKEVANGGNMIHPRYGSVLEILHSAVTGQGRATAEAARRMGGALNARVNSPGRSGAERPNVEAQIKKAGSMHDKVDIALRAAMEELSIGR